MNEKINYQEMYQIMEYALHQAAAALANGLMACEEMKRSKEVDDAATEAAWREFERDFLKMSPTGDEETDRPS